MSRPLSLIYPCFSVKCFGSPAVVVLSNKEKAARAGLIRQRTPPQCVMDDFLGEASLNAVLHWFLGGSRQWLSTGSAGEPFYRVLDNIQNENCYQVQRSSGCRSGFIDLETRKNAHSSFSECWAWRLYRHRLEMWLGDIALLGMANVFPLTAR